MESINSSRQDMSILLVEDNEITRNKLKKLLKKNYKDIIIAKDGIEALEIFQKYRLSNRSFDLIISDINMPKIDGIELLESVRSLDEFIPFIFVTGKLELNTLLKVVNLDINDYIMKPIDTTKLINSIEKIIKNKYKSSFLKTKLRTIFLSSTLYWNYDEKSLYYENEIVKLTKKEIELISILCRNINNIISTESLVYELWNDFSDLEVSILNLKNLISRIRKKIPYLLIENIYGLGYQIKVLNGKYK